MKRFIIIAGLVALALTSCKKFLEEQPRSKITPDLFFKTPNQIQTAVNGAYVGLETPWTSVFLGLPLSEYWSLNSLTGFSVNIFGTGNDEASFQRLDIIDPQNSYLIYIYKSVYTPMENINTVIANISNTTVIDAATRDNYLGQMYFLRAWHYFHGVQLFGEIPLKLTPTVSILDKDIQIPKAKIDAIYAQIVDDLTKAEASGLPQKDESGHITLPAVKSLLAKVYLTMAGYPLNKGTEYYQKAYDKAKEVITAAPTYNIFLFPTYADLRNEANENIGEHIFMAQRIANSANSEISFGMLPNIQPPISTATVFDAALTPTTEFYNSYDPGDLRTQDKQFFWQYQPGKIMVYKYWEEAPNFLISGENYWLIRYADVLLACAEAKARADGGSTSDPTAVSAYFAVRKRAFPAATPPGSITADQVLKERFWELCYENNINWNDMQRTRQTFDLVNKQIVPIIGFKAIIHSRPFTESDLLLPLPQSEVLLNPKLAEPAP